MIAPDTVLLGEYTIRQVETNELMPVVWENRERIFGGALDFNVQGVLSEEETAANARLRERMGSPYRLNIAVYHRGELVGWSFGAQESAEKYYMINTGLFPEHQGKGVYSALLPRILEMLKQEGFQIVYSRHKASNNQVLVPKLKAGFIVSGFEISDMFGLLVHLSYFFNPLRRKAMDFRTGQTRPDADLRPYLTLD